MKLLRKLSVGPAQSVLIISVALFLRLFEASFAMEDVKLHVADSGSVNTIVSRIGVAEGFYKEEGLNVLEIVARATVGIQGLLGRSFDFSHFAGLEK